MRRNRVHPTVAIKVSPRKWNASRSG